MNIVLLLAGVAGSRMGGGISKQFLSVYDERVIVHTIIKLTRSDGLEIFVMWHATQKRAERKDSE